MHNKSFIYIHMYTHPEVSETLKADASFLQNMELMLKDIRELNRLAALAEGRVKMFMVGI